MVEEMHAYRTQYEKITRHVVPGDFDRLCARHPDLSRLAKLLERLADGIASGRIRPDQIHRPSTEPSA